MKSVLDDIPGVGPARRKALMRHFKSLEEIGNATREELAEVPELNERTVDAILDFFAKRRESRSQETASFVDKGMAE